MSKAERQRARAPSRTAAISLAVVAACVLAGLFYVDAASGPAVKDVPSAVMRFATRFRMFNFNLPKSFPHDRTLEQEYAYWFLQGYIFPKGVWHYASHDVRSAAVAAAESYRVENPNETDAIMSGYGYQRVEVEGVWLRDSEKSEFVPKGLSSEAWWLCGFREFDPFHSPDVPPTEPRVVVRIVGYVSPLGSYGHLGASSRQLLVSSITKSHQ